MVKEAVALRRQSTSLNLENYEHLQYFGRSLLFTIYSAPSIRGPNQAVPFVNAAIHPTITFYAPLTGRGDLLAGQSVLDRPLSNPNYSSLNYWIHVLLDPSL